MDKTVDALNRAYHAMLLLCGAILLLLLGAARDPLANTHALEALTALERAHAGLALEVSAQLRDHYAPIFIEAAKGTSKEAYVTASRFGSEQMHLVWHPEGEQGPEADVTLDSAILLVGDLLNLVNRPSDAYAPIFKLEPQDLRRVLSYFDGVNPAIDDKHGNFEISWNSQLKSCTLALTSYWPKDASDLPRGYPLPCKPEDRLRIALSDYEMSWGNILLPFATQRLLPMAGLTVAQARNELKVLSGLEIAHTSEEIDLFGLKLRKDYLAILGPVILVLLLLQMLVYVSVLAKWSGDPPAALAAASWSRQFDGFFKPLFMSASVVALPAFICFWLTTQQPMPTIEGKLIGWGSLFVLPSLLSAIFLVRNICLARKVGLAAKAVSVEVLSLMPGALVGPQVLVKGSSLPAGSLVAVYVREGSGSWVRQGKTHYQGRLWHAAARFGDSATEEGTPFAVVALARQPDDPAAPFFEDRLDTLPPAISVSSVVAVARKGP